MVAKVNSSGTFYYTSASGFGEISLEMLCQGPDYFFASSRI